MTKIAFLGTGAMGSRMAQRLCADHDVTVWNRTPERIPATLPGAGARPAATPAEAAAGADVVIAMVRDDEASRGLWLTGVLDAMRPGSLAVECSTLSVAWTRELGRAAADRGIGFCEAPVAGSRPQAEAGQLIHLVGGESDAVSALAPILALTGGATHHLGPVGVGMAMKLIVNGLFGIQLAAIAELLALGERQGLAPEVALTTLAATPILSPAGRVSGEAMLAGRFAPAFPIDLVAKDFGLIGTAAVDPASVPVTSATAEVYRHAVEEGFGEENITGIVQRYRAYADQSTISPS